MKNKKKLGRPPKPEGEKILYTMIPCTTETRKLLRELKKRHPSHYHSWDSLLKYAYLVLSKYSPEIIMTVWEQPFASGKMSEKEWDNKRTRTAKINKKLEDAERDNKEQLEDLLK